MFVVHAEHPPERVLLQQQHPAVNTHFYVSTHQVNSLTSMVRSILFEYFRGSPPPLAKKITDLVIDSLNMTISFTLLRQILALIRAYSETVNLFSEYFEHQSTLVTNDEDILEGLKDQLSEIEEQVILENTRCSKLIYTTEFQETLQKEINQRSTIKPIKTKNTEIKEEGETILDSFVSKQKLEISLKRVMNKNLPEDLHWWRQENRKDHLASNNQSQSLVQFERKGSPLMRQDSLNELIRRQVEIGSSIESEYFIRDDKIKQVDRMKFNKKMKERLVSAKLKKRKKKR